VAFKTAKVYGPTHPAWITRTVEHVHDLQSTLTAMSGNGVTSERLRKIGFLNERLRDLCEMAKTDTYWRRSMPTFLRELARQLMYVEEVWAPGLIMNMIATADGLTDT
jgi:hypothetical protein